ncbi:hypothetical protein I5W21_05400 [Stenotrophomonas maltophilia]|jgi:hypothetical protein|uniref:hypothetical protein n=1 Tax=Stenotrophomonas TaxID=40323 RepID=UPI00066A96D4|nr:MULTISPECIES: hypothetical protein [Stenotrophomonas]MBH1460676.1 hypothetical protein [Stenotrophomonas maltophilia]MBH1486426.1 hypothetical protein [Stenotrophomonas maltophilia]MBH1839085.1 hypothetical protein [Stenotrophomonas maltophilia]MBN5138017.1 hypothetical protein [Stenotrophomonas maltophilia]MCU1050088.1 hypothetical protein [Stenotrophomonas maltophilia]
MWQRRTSLAELQRQRDVLQAEMDADALRRVSRLPPDDLVAALMPQARRLQELNQLILRATPPRELMKRLKALERQLLEPGAQSAGVRKELEDELRDLHLYFSNPRRRPLTAKVLLILLASVLAALFLPRLLVDLLVAL